MVWLDIDALVGTFLDVLLPRVGLDYIADYKTAYTILEIQTLENIFIHYICTCHNKCHHHGIIPGSPTPTEIEKGLQSQIDLPSTWVK